MSNLKKSINCIYSMKQNNNINGLLVGLFRNNTSVKLLKSEVRNVIFVSRKYFSSSNITNVIIPTENFTKLNKIDLHIPSIVSDPPSHINDETKSTIMNKIKKYGKDEMSIIEDNSDDSEFLTDKIAEKLTIPDALEPCNEDLSYLGRPLQPTFNFASYANKSKTIQELVNLGVELYKLENDQETMKSLLRRNFDEIKLYIQFLHDCGVSAEMIGSCLTKFPRIIDEDMDDLHTRIRYLRAHNFTLDSVAQIITKYPRWLSFTTKEIDRKLAYLQAELKLNGEQLRFIATRQPIVITANKSLLRETIFSFKEEMEFDKNQIQMIITNKPKLFITDRRNTLGAFNYVHNEMNISHGQIAQMPVILFNSVSRIKERHEFLKMMKRDQYNPKKPLYVSLDELIRPTDYEFCNRVAKTSIELYDMFLKTR